MKFNWRANWEILLVFVIIVIGIVVTTIAAIRSKDKSLLILPDESDYGQLLSVGAIGAANSGNSGGYGSLAETTTTSPELTKSPDRPAHKPRSKSSMQQQQQQDLGPLSTPKVQRSTGKERHSKQRTNNTEDRPKSAANDSGTLSRPQPTERVRPTSGDDQEAAYEASTGEAADSILAQKRNNRSKQAASNDFQSAKTSSAQQQSTDNENFYQDDVTDVDDIHTTRSSTAQATSGSTDFNSDKQAEQTATLRLNGTSAPGNSSSVVPYEHRGSPSSVSLFAPYRAALHQTIPEHLSALQLHHQHLKAHQQQTAAAAAANDPPTLESADMATSFGKPLNGSSATDLIGDDGFGFNNSTKDQLAAHLFDSAVLSSLMNNGNNMHLYTEHQPHFLKTHTATMPFSLILNDLMKLSRSQSPLVNPQASSVDEPVNSARPQLGILRQLRSFPGPLMALLQGTSSGNSGSSMSSSASEFLHPNYDASESSQHYQRIPPMSPSDIESIVARSARSSSVLPAFPAPKNVPQPWYPQTVGGNPSINSAVNSNADFVANRAAGFVRLDSQQPPSYYNRMDENVRSNPSPDDAQNNQPQDSYKQPNVYPQQQQQQQNQAPSQQQQTAPVSSSYVQAQTNNNNQQQNSWTQQDNSPVQYSPQRNNNMQQQQPYNSILIQQQQQQPQSSFISTDFRSGGMNGHPMGRIVQQHDPINNLQQQIKTNMDLNTHMGTLALSESSPQPSVAAMNPPTGTKISLNQIESKVAGKALNRKRRDATREIDDYAEFANDDINNNDGRDERFSGSNSVSVVHPDGRPTKGIRINYRPNRDFEEHDGEQSVSSNRKHSGRDDVQVASSMAQLKLSHVEPHASDGASLDQYASSKHKKLPRQQQKNRDRKLKAHKSKSFKPNNGYKQGTVLDTAGSGLMSKLLGTASTNDELEDDIDSDDEDGFSGERRSKEDLDGVDEFNNDPQPIRSRGGYSLMDDGSNEGAFTPRGLNHAQQSNADDPSIGTGSSEKEGYTSQRDQNQRSDIEFYGHPGEETRQLKYGILGSGNYEVVNGGVYPEADESTAAAVNSIANYVRKPNGLLMADLPRIISSGQSDQDNSLAAAFVPGGRLPNSGGFMRVASGNPNELVSLLPPNKLDAEKGFSGQLLQFIDTPSSDPSAMLAAHLGGSGTSARTTFAIKDGASEESDTGADHMPNRCSDKSAQDERCNRPQRPSGSVGGDDGQDLNKVSSGRQRKKQSKADRYSHHNRDEDRRTDIENDTSGGGSQVGSQRIRFGSQSQKSNQFNVYQISPSKKVTIFSDQDLDSAPSESNEIATR